jgi:hypothetical protein
MAGLEERLGRLEGIINKLFCCDSSQFTGPQGPQGIPGIGTEGPPGADGAVGPAGLNWQGVWESGVLYSQNDAVSYGGSSWFLNCESTETFENENPADNPCWVLLANMGATGPQGPTGNTGNDGSNSGRWFFGVVDPNPSSPLNPGGTFFNADNVTLSDITRIFVSFADSTTINYTDWWQALYDFTQDYDPLVFVQITELNSNNIIGIYKLGVKPPSDEDITMHSGFVELGLDPMYVSSNDLTSNNLYTISWSIHGGVNSSLAPQTEELYTAVHAPGPYPSLVDNFCFVENFTEGNNNYVELPVPTDIGQSLITAVRGTLPLSIITDDGTSKIYVGTDVVSEFRMQVNDVYRFTWSGTYWYAEHLEEQATTFNSFRLTKAKYQITETIWDTTTTTFPTQSSLNTTYSNSLYPVGLKLYIKNLPGGARAFVKVSDVDWISYPINIV